jgi:hypothetical protein
MQQLNSNYSLSGNPRVMPGGETVTATILVA